MTSENKEEIYKRAGLGNRLGFGKSPALVVVDMQIGFTVPEKSPLAGNLDKELVIINRLIEIARQKGVPIIFTAIGFEPKHQVDGGLWVEKAPTLRHLKRGSELVEIDPRLFRPADASLLIGDASKAQRELGWTPRTSFQDLVEIMVKEDLSRVGSGSIEA